MDGVMDLVITLMDGTIVRFNDQLKVAEYDPDQPRVPAGSAEGGQFASWAQAVSSVPASSTQNVNDWTDADEPARLAVEARLNELLTDYSRPIPRDTNFVVGDEPAVRTAQAVVDTLIEMKTKGYTMPARVSVVTSNQKDIAGSVDPNNLHLKIHIPGELPRGANLDDAVKIGFSSKTDGQDDFVPRTMREVIVHEMAHIQYAAKASWRNVNLNTVVRDFAARTKNDFENIADSEDTAVERMMKAISSVSTYGHQAMPEFIAEAFTRKYRGEKLSRDAQLMYDLMKGPDVL